MYYKNALLTNFVISSRISIFSRIHEVNKLIVLGNKTFKSTSNCMGGFTPIIYALYTYSNFKGLNELYAGLILIAKAFLKSYKTLFVGDRHMSQHRDKFSQNRNH